MIRAILREDLPEIRELRCSVAENHLSIAELEQKGITAESIWADIERGGLAGWLIEEGKTIVSFAMANRETGSIFGLFTRPGHEGRGYGDALLSRALDWLKECGHGEVWLSTERGSYASRFYAKRGWRESGPSRFDPRDVEFRKTL